MEVTVKPEINYWIVFLAAAVYYAGGAIWYSSNLFGNAWKSLEGINSDQMEQKKKGRWKVFVIGFFAALIMSYILAHLINYTHSDTFIKGIKTGFICWSGFIITTMLINNSFAGKSVKLLLINSGYHLYGLLVMGAILAVWS